MTHPDLARYHALLAEADALARTLFWRVTLTEETVDAIAERLRSLLAERPFIVREQTTLSRSKRREQVYPHCRLPEQEAAQGIYVIRSKHNEQTWVEVSLWLEGGPHYHFSNQVGPLTTPTVTVAPESVTIERFVGGGLMMLYPQRIVFALEEGENH